MASSANNEAYAVGAFEASDEEEVVSAEPTEAELEAVPCISCDSEDHAYKDCEEDNWTFSEDDFQTAKKEN